MAKSTPNDFPANLPTQNEQAPIPVEAKPEKPKYIDPDSQPELTAKAKGIVPQIPRADKIDFASAGSTHKLPNGTTVKTN